MNKPLKTTGFIEDAISVWEEAGPGITRKIMAYDKTVMMVKVAFEKGAVGTVHKHHHTQSTYIESGTFEVEIDGEKKILKKGDGFFISSDILHGVVCRHEGVLIDVFHPMREDFV
jgi:quercetin dioxygenase-like cupin family protein